MIETERSILRPFEESDFEGLKSVWGDRETMSFFPKAYSDEEIRNIIAKHMKTYKEHGYGLFAVLDKKTGSGLG